jgi:hypothetical protein
VRNFAALHESGNGPSRLSGYLPRCQLSGYPDIVGAGPNRRAPCADIGLSLNDRYLGHLLALTVC